MEYVQGIKVSNMFTTVKLYISKQLFVMMIINGVSYVEWRAKLIAIIDYQLQTQVKLKNYEK